MIDLSTVPDAALYREINRRRARTAGRKRKPTPCLRCGVPCASAREARQHCSAANLEFRRRNPDRAVFDRTKG